jgi:5-formyltetrahydrofolate cyclo-ligase
MAASKSAPNKIVRTRKERKFPALTFEEAIKLAQAIQEHAAGQKVRRLTLFEKLNQDPGSTETRRAIWTHERKLQSRPLRTDAGRERGNQRGDNHRETFASPL